MPNGARHWHVTELQYSRLTVSRDLRHGADKVRNQRDVPFSLSYRFSSRQPFSPLLHPKRYRKRSRRAVGTAHAKSTDTPDFAARRTSSKGKDAWVGPC